HFIYLYIYIHTHTPLHNHNTCSHPIPSLLTTKAKPLFSFRPSTRRRRRRRNMVADNQAYGLAAIDQSGVVSPFKFSRRETGEKDVKFKVVYCGICHSDLHMLKNEWGTSTYPIVPGHEIVGEVTEVGSKVEKYKVGDRVGVGCMVGSCRSCDSCSKSVENYCPKMILTYGATYHDGTHTYGGYSNVMVCDEHFVVRVPDSLALDAAAPLLCAGITLYSPLRFYGLDKPGLHIGIVGLGGLGHVGVKFAKAMGVKVTVISTSPAKKQEAIERHGADAFLVSRDQDQMKVSSNRIYCSFTIWFSSIS
ncbi:Probable mannitol dehydrogenase, partial [Linum perenne]